MIREELSIRNKDSMEYARAVFYGHEDTPRMPIGARPVIVICPGGAYEYTSPREGDIVASQFLSMGYHVAVLEYSCAPARYPVALLELATVFKILRENAGKWHIDKDRIIVMGFSAGGHLACSLSSFWNNRGICDIIGCSADMIKPNGQILCYPVITTGRYAHPGSIRNLLGDEYEARKEEFSLEKQVNADVPRSFVWHTVTDGSVPVQNSLLYVNALIEAGISVEYHLFENGGHGLSLGTQLSATEDKQIVPCVVPWLSMAGTWIGSPV